MDFLWEPHLVGNGWQVEAVVEGVFHAHRPQGWAPTATKNTPMAFGLNPLSLFANPFEP